MSLGSDPGFLRGFPENACGTREQPERPLREPALGQTLAERGTGSRRRRQQERWRC